MFESAGYCAPASVLLCVDIYHKRFWLYPEDQIIALFFPSVPWRGEMFQIISFHSPCPSLSFRLTHKRKQHRFPYGICIRPYDSQHSLCLCLSFSLSLSLSIWAVWYSTIRTAVNTQCLALHLLLNYWIHHTLNIQDVPESYLWFSVYWHNSTQFPSFSEEQDTHALWNHWRHFNTEYKA